MKMSQLWPTKKYTTKKTKKPHCTDSPRRALSDISNKSITPSRPNLEEKTSCSKYGSRGKRERDNKLCGTPFTIHEKQIRFYSPHQSDNSIPSKDNIFYKAHTPKTVEKTPSHSLKTLKESLRRSAKKHSNQSNNCNRAFVDELEPSFSQDCPNSRDSIKRKVSPKEDAILNNYNLKICLRNFSPAALSRSLSPNKPRSFTGMSLQRSFSSASTDRKMPAVPSEEGFSDLNLRRQSSRGAPKLQGKDRRKTDIVLSSVPSSPQRRLRTRSSSERGRPILRSLESFLDAESPQNSCTEKKIFFDLTKGPSPEKDVGEESSINDDPLRGINLEDNFDEDFLEDSTTENEGSISRYSPSGSYASSLTDFDSPFSSKEMRTEATPSKLLSAEEKGGNSSGMCKQMVDLEIQDGSSEKKKRALCLHPSDTDSLPSRDQLEAGAFRYSSNFSPDTPSTTELTGSDPLIPVGRESTDEGVENVRLSIGQAKYISSLNRSISYAQGEPSTGACLEVKMATPIQGVMGLTWRTYPGAYDWGVSECEEKATIEHLQQKISQVKVDEKEGTPIVATRKYVYRPGDFENRLSVQLSNEFDGDSGLESLESTESGSYPGSPCHKKRDSQPFILHQCRHVFNRIPEVDEEMHEKVDDASQMQKMSGKNSLQRKPSLVFFMDGTSAKFTPRCEPEDSTKQRRKRQSYAKSRRVSLGIANRLQTNHRLSTMDTDTCLKSSVVPKAIRMSLSGLSLNRTSALPRKLSSRRASTRHHPINRDLALHDVNIDIVGGTLQGFSDEGIPIICSPGPSDNRVIRAELTPSHGIRLHLRKHQTDVKSNIDFSPERCHAFRAKPTGILLSDGNKKFYYIQEDYTGILGSLAPLMDSNVSQLRTHRLPFNEFSRIDEDDESELDISDTVGDISLEASMSNISISSSPAQLCPSSPKPMDLSSISCAESSRQPLSSTCDFSEAFSTEETNDSILCGDSAVVMEQSFLPIENERWKLFLPLLEFGIEWIQEDGLKELGNTCRGLKVSATCAQSAFVSSLYAELMEDLETTPPGLHKPLSHSQLCKKYPWGCFLSDGAFKQVFRVWSEGSTHEMAVSVMDLERIKELENGAVVCQELHVSLLLSSLVRWGQCCNFVAVMDTFTCNYPPTNIWGSEENRFPQGAKYNKTKSIKKICAPTKDKGKYQYILMELCSGGDIEDYIRKQSQNVLSLTQTRSFLFQMVASLYTAQRVFGLRHYDVKLLNFLLKESKCKDLVYCIDSTTYKLEMDTEDQMFLVKLADFGTADVSPSTLGEPIGIEQFTTLENTPIEYLFLGSEAHQDYSADVFSLSLSILHLYTGEAPYEELLASCQCPEIFTASIKKHWESKASRNKKYTVIKQVIDGCEEEDKPILYNTLYRYLVLFGMPDKSALCYYGDKSPVLTEICNLLDTNTVFQDTFNTHRKKFSLEFGLCAPLVRARQRLQEQNGSKEFLLDCAHYNPNKRIKMSSALSNDIFMEYRNQEFSEDSETQICRVSFAGVHC